MTPDQARDEMLAVFKSFWDTTGYTVAWEDVPSAPPATEQPWARVSVRHGPAAQSTLANNEGVRKYTAVGSLWIQLFTPIGQGGTLGYTLAQSVLTAYRAARGSVWYRNHRFREVPGNGGFTLINCIIDFTYDS